MRDVAPGQTKGAGESAREEAPGRNKTGQSARDEAPGQMKDRGTSGASDGSSGSGDKAADRNKDKRSETKSDTKADKAGERNDRAGRSDRDDGKDRAAGRDGAGKDSESKDRAADTNRDRSRDTADREQDRSSDRDRGATGGGAGEAGKTKSLNVTQEQRTQVKSVFVKHRDRAVVRDIDVSLNVGVVVPRSVRLYSVPSDIVAIVPEYRTYEYFVYENKVVIVDPATFEIVDIIILA